MLECFTRHKILCTSSKKYIPRRSKTVFFDYDFCYLFMITRICGSITIIHTVYPEEIVVSVWGGGQSSRRNGVVVVI